MDVQQVEVRRNAPLFATVGLVSVVLAIGYLVRAIGHGGVFPWVAGLLLGGLGIAMLVSWIESRTPLMVADDFGIRIRLGSEWRGLPWDSLEQVVVEQRTSVMHDGRLVVVPREAEALDGLDGRARAQIAVTERLYGSELVVPLGMTTRVSVPQLVDALAELAATRSAVIELASWAAEPVVPLDPAHVERREAARARAQVGGHLVESRFERQARAFEGLSIFEDLATSVGSGVSRGVTNLMTVIEQRRSREQVDVRLADFDVVQVDGANALQLDALPDPIDDDAAELPEADLLHREADTGWELAGGIGERLHEARERLDLSVERLAERTRIQPSVIEGIEDDDFGPCGGDFYARGHLRTLATALGVPGDELVAAYDAQHASAPVNASRVFEADLATSRDEEQVGRRWAMVLGIALTLVLAWGLARLFTDQPAKVSAPAIDTAGLASQQTHQKPITSAYGAAVPVRLTAARGPATVTVRDHSGKVLFHGYLVTGGSKQVVGLRPFRVSADQPANVDVRVAGKPRGAVGTGYTRATRLVR